MVLLRLLLCCSRHPASTPHSKTGANPCQHRSSCSESLGYPFVHSKIGLLLFSSSWLQLELFLILPFLLLSLRQSGDQKWRKSSGPYCNRQDGQPQRLLQCVCLDIAGIDPKMERDVVIRLSVRCCSVSRLFLRQLIHISVSSALRFLT